MPCQTPNIQQPSTLVCWLCLVRHQKLVYWLCLVRHQTRNSQAYWSVGCASLDTQNWSTGCALSDTKHTWWYPAQLMELFLSMMTGCKTPSYLLTSLSERFQSEWTAEFVGVSRTRLIHYLPATWRFKATVYTLLEKQAMMKRKKVTLKPGFHWKKKMFWMEQQAHSQD